MANNNNNEINADLVREVASTISKWYVRRDGKFFALSELFVRKSKHDVHRECLIRLPGHFEDLDENVIAAAFKLAIEAKHADRNTTIAVWNGRIACRPDVPEPIIWNEGSASVNSWSQPSYRSKPAEERDLAVANEFFNWVLPREKERTKFLDWLAWNLQNEADKPAWAPFLYSENKGTGKSVLCQMVVRLFGNNNSVIQNSVEKLTARFNSTVLQSKMVVCEEINLRPDSPQGNALKTFITERNLMSERKGHEPERLEQRCCFMLTSNHLPLWIEQHDRRYYLIEVDHEGHASGDRSREFVDLVERFMRFMEEDANVASLHRWLLDRQLSEGFSARTLNLEEDRTPLMERVHGASQATMSARLDEWLSSKRAHAVPEALVVAFIQKELHASPNAVKHMMSSLRWHRENRKWGKRDYSRAIWLREGFAITRGKLSGPGGFEEDLAEHINGVDGEAPGFNRQVRVPGDPADEGY